MAEELENLIDEHYDERVWEIERGIPAKGKLLELGLAATIRTLIDMV